MKKLFFNFIILLSILTLPQRLFSQTNIDSMSRVYMHSSHEPSLIIDESNFNYESVIFDFEFRSFSHNEAEGRFDLEIFAIGNIDKEFLGSIFFYSLELNLGNEKIVTKIDGDGDPISFEEDHIRVDFRPNGVNNRDVEVNSVEIAFDTFSQERLSFSFDLIYTIKEEEHTVKGEVIIIF